MKQLGGGSSIHQSEKLLIHEEELKQRLGGGMHASAFDKRRDYLVTCLTLTHPPFDFFIHSCTHHSLSQSQAKSVLLPHHTIERPYYQLPVSNYLQYLL